MAFPGTLNIEYYRGDTYKAVLYPVDSNGNAFDLGTVGDAPSQFTGTFNVATARGTAGTHKFSETLAFDYAVDSITYTITPENGALLEAGGAYVYDIEITRGTGNQLEVYTLLTGNIIVTDDVKKA